MPFTRPLFKLPSPGGAWLSAAALATGLALVPALATAQATGSTGGANGTSPATFSAAVNRAAQTGNAPGAAAGAKAAGAATTAAPGSAAAAAAPAVAKAAATPVVTLETSAGPIVIELDAEHAPKSVANFLRYAKEGFYNGTIFHRVIPGFMAQAGGYTVGLSAKPTHPPVVSESSNGLKNLRGSIAMARTNDPNSATSQFFINVSDNAGLDYAGMEGSGYTVFGHVTAGMDVVDQIVTSPTRVEGFMFQNLPITEIVIRKARLK
jgi:cyclophilin family peptidyl-prolyl cis-trans isomerase